MKKTDKAVVQKYLFSSGSVLWLLSIVNEYSVESLMYESTL